MNSITSFSRMNVKNGQLVIETVIETSLDLIPLEGVAKVIAFGGNGSFKFILNNKVYTSTTARQYALLSEGLIHRNDNETYAGGVDPKSQAFTIENVTFEGVQPTSEEWSKVYIYSDTKSYWKEVV